MPFDKMGNVPETRKNNNTNQGAKIILVMTVGVCVRV